MRHAARLCIMVLLIALPGGGLRAWSANPPQDTSHRALPPQLKELPLVQVRASGPGDVLAVLISGDGGWAALPSGVAGVLARGGVEVVGWNALDYLWKRRTPDEAGRDLETILRASAPWTGRQKVVLVGYSRGADMLPFMVNRLPADLRRQIRLLALIGPSLTVDFKFHVADWWSNASRRTDLPVLPELSKLVGGLRMLCVYGAEEHDSTCPELPQGAAELVRLPGAHHFDGGYEALGELVLKAVQAATS